MPQLLQIPRLEVQDVDEEKEGFQEENGKVEEEKPPNSALFSPFSFRLHIVFMMMGGFCCVQFITISLALTITCMVNSTAVAELQRNERISHFTESIPHYNLSTTSLPKAEFSLKSEQCESTQTGDRVVVDYGGSLIWDHRVQNLLFKGTFLGALFTAIPAIFVLQRYSIKRIVAFSVILYSLCALIVPYLALNYGENSVFASRLVMGLAESFAHPSFNTLISNWFPITERSTAIALYTTGNQLATAGGNPLCAWFCRSSFGWQGVFYMSGIVGFSWTVIWLIFSSNQPSKCKFMSPKEKAYLSFHCVTRSHRMGQNAAPYKKILTSRPFLAQLQAHFFVSMIASMLQLYLPSYFKEVLLLGIMENGVYTAIPNVAMFVWKLCWSMIMDKCKAKHILTPTQAVKLSQAMACFGMALNMVSIAFFVDCSTPLLALSLVTLTWCSMGCSVSGFITSMLSIAPRYTATISAISTFVALLGRLCAPQGVGLIKKTGTLAEWKSIFLYGGAMVAFSGILFLIFGSAEVQPWGEEDSITEDNKEEREIEYEMMIKERRHTASISIQ